MKSSNVLSFLFSIFYPITSLLYSVYNVVCTILVLSPFIVNHCKQKVRFFLYCIYNLHLVCLDYVVLLRLPSSIFRPFSILVCCLWFLSCVILLAQVSCSNFQLVKCGWFPMYRNGDFYPSNIIISYIIIRRKVSMIKYVHTAILCAAYSLYNIYVYTTHGWQKSCFFLSLVSCLHFSLDFLTLVFLFLFVLGSHSESDFESHRLVQ